MSQKVPDGKRWIVTKDEEEVATSSGASIGRFGTGGTVLERKEKEFRRFSVKSSNLCRDL